MKNLVSTAFLVAIMICGLTLANDLHLSVAQYSTSVSGIITSNTTWTKANSPYSLSGPVAVNNGITLTIEAGATVNLNSFYIEVNGTLLAIGTSSNPININGGSSAGDLLNPFVPLKPSAITFFGSGTIEYANMKSQISIYNSPMITNINGANILVLDGSPIISNNFQIGISAIGGNPAISGNTNASFYIVGSPVITNNTIIAGIQIKGGNALISNNVISGSFDAGCIGIDAGNPTIEGNLIMNTYKGGVGIEISSYAKPIIQYNTIANCSNGITTSTGNLLLTLKYNNFQNISGYTIYWSASSNLDATNNWWGTTDVSVINQSIHDFKNDFNLGTVSFVPFLTSPNSQAPAIPNATPSPIQTATPPQSQSPSSSLTPSPSVPEFPTWIILPLVLIATISTSLIIRKKTPIAKNERLSTIEFLS